MSNVRICGTDIYIDGERIPPLPKKPKSIRVKIIGENIYVSGFQYKNGKWKRTLSAFLNDLMF